MSAHFSDYQDLIVTNASSDLEVLRNRTVDEIAVGDRATIERALTAERMAAHQALAALRGAESTMPAPPAVC